MASTAMAGEKRARVKPSGSAWALRRMAKASEERVGVNVDGEGSGCARWCQPAAVVVLVDIVDQCGDIL